MEVKGAAHLKLLHQVQGEVSAPPVTITYASQFTSAATTLPNGTVLPIDVYNIQFTVNNSNLGGRHLLVPSTSSSSSESSTSLSTSSADASCSGFLEMWVFGCAHLLLGNVDTSQYDQRNYRDDDEPKP